MYNQGARAAARAVQSTASVDQPIVPTGGSSSSGQQRMRHRWLPSIKFRRHSNLVDRGPAEKQAMGTQNVHCALGEATELLSERATALPEGALGGFLPIGG